MAWNKHSRTWQWAWLLWWCLPFIFLIALITYLYVELQRVRQEQILISSQLEIVNKDKAELRLSSSDLTARHIDYQEGLQDLQIEAEDWKDKTKKKEQALNRSHSALDFCELEVMSRARDSSEYSFSKESTMSSKDGANRNKPGRSNKTQKEEQTGDRARRLFRGPATCVDSDAPGKCDKNNVFDYCGAWKVISGNCEVDFTSQDCISSPNFPAFYPPNDHCEVTINKLKTRPFYAQTWSPDTGDTLTIDGATYTKTEPAFFAGPDGWKEKGTSNFVPEDSLVWSSDASVESFGWKICALQTLGPITLARDFSRKDLAPSPGTCVLTAGDTCAQSRCTGSTCGSRCPSSGTTCVPESGDECFLLVSGRQTLNFEWFDSFTSSGCDSTSTNLYQNMPLWWPRTDPTDTDTKPEATGGCCDVFRYKANDTETIVIVDDPTTCTQDDFDVTDVHGPIHWKANSAPFPNRDPNSDGVGWKFCVKDEDESCKQPGVCERTCGGCIQIYKEELLRECIDDVWFEEGCLYFAEPGVGFTSDPLSIAGEKCTQGSAGSVLSTWNNDKSTTISEADLLFVRRLRLHCPLSCGVCTQCVQGRYRDESVIQPSAADACKDCPIGQYQNSVHQFECMACAAGKYQDSTGSTACKLCQAGMYSTGTAADGNACGVAGIAQCTLCSAGKMQADIGETACVDCVPGKSQFNEGQAECLPCPVGTYESKIAAVNCTLCEPGKVGANASAVSCSDCSSGMYQDGWGQTACKKCGAGRYNSDTGTKECIKCTAGAFQNELASVDCNECGVGNYSNLSGSSGCQICPEGLTTLIPSSRVITDCVCPAGTYGLQGSGEDTCAACPAGFYCPGGHSYSNSSIDETPMLLPAYMSLPEQPYKAFTCQGARKICSGNRKPLYNSESPHDWSQVCGKSGRIDQACAGCPLDTYKNSEGCDECSSSDSMIFWIAMPCLFATMVALHIFWSKPSSQERADLKGAMVGFNLYLLYIQLLGVFQTVMIDWKSPFKEFLELTSYMRMRTDFLKPSCGIEFDPTRDYITRGLMPLAGMLSLCAVFVICQGVSKVMPQTHDYLPLPLRRWMYFVNTIGAVYMLFSSGIALTSFLPHQCQANPGGQLSNIEWPLVLCSWDDSNYLNMTLFSVFAILVYVAFFPSLCVYQVLTYPVRAVADPHFFVKYKFLFQNYSAEARYWGLVIMLRNVFVAMALAFLQQDTFFQVTVMMFIMVLYLALACLCWPWSLYQVNYLDIVGSIGLSFIMSIGTGFIEQDVNQGSLLVLLGLIFGSLIMTFVVCILYYLLSFATGRYDFTIFLSHAKFNGGAVARLFKTQLGHRLSSSEKIFLDSDNLVSLHELHVFVQHTRNLTLLLTPDCYAREWVAVEIVTSYLHDVHVILISINKGLAPDEAFVTTIPNVFCSCLEGRFPSMGITVKLLEEAYAWIAEKGILLDFDVYSAPGKQNRFFNKLIPELSVGRSSQLKAVLESSNFLASFKVRPPKDKDDGKNDEGRLPTLTETTRVFLCRERAVDVQQEASCICLKITLSALLHGDVYMAPVNTEFASSVQILDKLPSHAVMLMCLTKTLFTCLDTITEVSVGVLHDLFVIPVQIDNNFPYPGDAFYESFGRGEVLGLGDTKKQGMVYEALTKVLQTIFTEIAIPFNANAPETAIKSSGKGVVNRYNLCQQDTAGVVGMIMSRLKDFEKKALEAWVDRRKDGIEELAASRPIEAVKPSPSSSPGLAALPDAPSPAQRKTRARSDPKEDEAAWSDAPSPAQRKTRARSDPERGDLDNVDNNKGTTRSTKRERTRPKLETPTEKSTDGDDIPLFGGRKRTDDSDSPPARQNEKSRLKTYMENKSRRGRGESAPINESWPDATKSTGLAPHTSKPNTRSDPGLVPLDLGESQPRVNLTESRPRPRERLGDAKMRDFEREAEESARLRGPLKSPTRLQKKPSPKDRTKTGDSSGAEDIGSRAVSPSRARPKKIQSRENPAQAGAATGSSDQPYKPNPKASNSLPTVEPVITPPAPGKSRLARW